MQKEGKRDDNFYVDKWWQEVIGYTSRSDTQISIIP